MKQRYLIFLTVLLTILIACTGDQQPTPTPFPEVTTTEEALDPTASLAISITDLAADPEAYGDSFVEITGRYQQLPLLVCDSDAYPAPATWQLQAEDGSLIAVGGFDSQVRSLLPNDLTMTVSGVWQLFEGPVGCGKSAASTQIWYLKASDILSPSPIAQVTLTPTGAASQVADTDGQTAVPTDGDDANLAATPTLDNAGDEPVGTPTSASTTIPAPPDSTATFTTVPPTSDPGDANDDRTATPTSSSGGNSTATATSSGGSGTATPTDSNGTATPTSTNGGSGSPTPTSVALTTATRDPNEFDTVEFDELSPEVPVLELLAPQQVHLYPIAFDYDGAITITAVAEPTVNLVLEIIDPADDVVQQANNGGNGELETIVNAQLNVALDYKIRLFDLNGTEGDYCLIFSEGGGFPDTIKGRIDYGQTKQDQVEVLGIDYWCFLGAEGESISIASASTATAGDFVLGLFGPPDFDAIGTVFQDAEIMNTRLEENGMYIIGVLDFEAGASGYSLTLTKN